jgi:hypothetical protein
MSDREVAHVDLDEFRQVVRQARDVELVDDVVRHAALFLARRATFSALTKCSGTFMWILRSFETRWKSTCCTWALNGCMLYARSSTGCFRRVELQRQDRRVERFVAQMAVELLVVELDVHRVAPRRRTGCPARGRRCACAGLRRCRESRACAR